MPRALYDGLVDGAFTQRASHVGAPIVHAVDLPADLEERHRSLSKGRAHRFPLLEFALGSRIDAHDAESPQTTFVICASRSAASWVRPASPRIVYRSGGISCAWISASRTSSSVRPRARAVAGAPIARSGFRTSSQFPPCADFIIIVPPPPRPPSMPRCLP